MGLPVLSFYYIRKSRAAFFAFGASVVSGVNIDDLDIPGDDMDLLTHQLFPDFFKQRSAKGADPFGFINIKVFIPLPAVRILFSVGMPFLLLTS